MALPNPAVPAPMNENEALTKWYAENGARVVAYARRRLVVHCGAAVGVEDLVQQAMLAARRKWLTESLSIEALLPLVLKKIHWDVISLARRQHAVPGEVTLAITPAAEAIVDSAEGAELQRTLAPLEEDCRSTCAAFLADPKLDEEDRELMVRRGRGEAYEEIAIVLAERFGSRVKAATLKVRYSRLRARLQAKIEAGAAWLKASKTARNASELDTNTIVKLLRAYTQGVTDDLLAGRSQQSNEGENHED